MRSLQEVRRNWLLLLAAVTGGAMVNIPTYGLGIFMPIWEQEFGWSRSQIGLAMTFFIGVLVVTSPVAGWVVDRFGARRPILATTFLIPIGLLLISRTGPEIWTLYAGYAAFAVLASLGTSVAYTRSVAQYFTAGRGLAFGITTSATSVALLTAPPIFLWLLGRMEWREAWMVVALIPLLLLPLLFFGIKDTPVAAAGSPAPTPEASGVRFREILGSYRFWALGVAFLLASFAVAGASFQMVPILRERGVSVEAAIATQAMLGVGLATSRLICGFILDHVFGPIVFVTIMIAAALGFGGMLAGPLGLSALYMFAIGAALGAEGDVLAYMCSRYFGLRSYARIYGCLFGLMNCGAMLTPVVYGHLYDLQGTYAAALWCAIIALVVASGLVATLGRYPVAKPAAVGGDGAPSPAIATTAPRQA